MCKDLQGASGPRRPDATCRACNVQSTTTCNNECTAPIAPERVKPAQVPGHALNIVVRDAVGFVGQVAAGGVGDEMEGRRQSATSGETPRRRLGDPPPAYARRASEVSTGRRDKARSHRRWGGLGGEGHRGGLDVRSIWGGRARAVGDERVDPLGRSRPGVNPLGGRIRELAGLELVDILSATLWVTNITVAESRPRTSDPR